MRFEDFLTDELGQPKENTIGELRYCCPFCGETKYKFYVKQSIDSSNGLYHCKKCNESGNPITFMKKYYGVNGKQAVDLLDSKSIDIERQEIIQFSNNDLTESEKLILMMRGVDNYRNYVKKIPPPLPVGFKYIKDNLNNKEVAPFLVYLKNRGITLAQIIEHNIAYIVNGYCYSKGNNGETKKITLRNSVIFFTYNSRGKYLYWNTRSIEPNPYLKSINAPAQEHELGKRDVIFNLNRAMKEKMVVITEGVFDALTYQQYGIATFGKQVTEEQLSLLREYVPIDTSIMIMLDSDAMEFSVELAKKLYITHKKVYVIPHGDLDANDLGVEEAFKLLKNRVLASPEGLQSYFLQQKLSKWA